ncbi:MAG: nickel insertion protein [Acetobacteraceae bacterium]
MSLTIRLDAVGGMAGDMFVAAMLDALPDLHGRVLADAAAVLPPGIGLPMLQPGTSGGLRCLRFHLAAQAEADHHHAMPASGAWSRASRAASLTQGTAAHAVAILRLLAEAEAAIHDVPVDEVHFHEIGDWDSLMDVTAAGSIAAAPCTGRAGRYRTCRAAMAWCAPSTGCCLCRPRRRPGC